MKNITIIKKTINVFYYLLNFGFAIEAVKLIYYVVLGNIDNLKPKFIGNAVSYTDNTNILTVSSHIISLGLIYIFILVVERLRKSSYELEKENYFHATVINNFRKVGVLLLIFSMIKFVGKIIFPLLFNSPFRISSENFPIFYVLLGLFFMFLSEVFKKAKIATEENNLTI